MLGMKLVKFTSDNARPMIRSDTNIEGSFLSATLSTLNHRQLESTALENTN